MTVIEKVTVAQPADIQFSLDWPKQGTQFDYLGLEVGGWAYCSRIPVEFVDLVFPEEHFVRVRVHLPRPDVAAYLHAPLAQTSGFFGRIGALGFPPESEVELWVVLKNAERFPIATVNWRRPVLHSSFEPIINPLLVTSLGRSGSSRLMLLLSRHPEIVAPGIFPFETLATTYWLKLLQFMAMPGRVTSSPCPSPPSGIEWLGEADPTYYDFAEVAAAPEWFGPDYVQDALSFCQKSIDRFCRQVASAKAHVRYFAQKAGPPPARLVRETYPRSKEIFLVRDFRDMFCSMRSFNEKRGYPNFLREKTDSDQEHINLLAEAAERLLHHWHSRENDSLLVHYEDLIKHAHVTLKRIFQYLELDNNPSLVDHVLDSAGEEPENVRTHKTSESDDQSIGRWQHDLDDALGDWCQKAFQKPLDGFGYADKRQQDSLAKLIPSCAA